MLKISLVFIALGLIAKQIDAQTSCTPNPCGTGNTCYLQNGIAKCSCASSYVGSKCQLINPCNAKPCGTRGACFPVVSTGTNGVETATYYCQCYSGYSGPTCESTSGADPCASSPCLNSGVCTKAQNTNGYTCTCVGPYTGTNCGTYIDYCSGNKCQNNALCVPDPTNQAYTCDCKVGFYGPYCENKLNNCQVNVNGQLVSPCQNGATCLDLIDGYVCQCVGPYAGVNCETYVNPCNSNPCGSGAVCTPTTTTLGYTCTCAVGYFGSPCIPDPCMSSPCRYQGSRCVPIQPGVVGSCTCPTTTATYVCICPGSSPEYAGNC